MPHAAPPLDLHMPLLAFAALMFEHGSPLSAAHWDALEALEDGLTLDTELQRAQAWLLAQDKGSAMGPLLRHLCALHEERYDDEGDTWAQLVALPVVGTPAALGQLARSLAQLPLTALTQTGRLPSDARLFFLPQTFEGPTVDGWWITPRQGLLDATLDLAECDDATVREQLALLGTSMHPASEAGRDAEVRLLLGVYLSAHPTWLDGQPEDPASHLIAVGQDLETFLEEVGNQLETQGLPADVDDALFEEAFQKAHGLPPEAAAEVRAHALDQERRAWDQILIEAGVAEVEVQFLQTWSLALQERATLALRHATVLDRRAHGVTDLADYTRAYVAADDVQGDLAWAVAEDEQGVLWGPYALEGVALLGGLLPRMVDEAFSRDPETGSVEVMVCASPLEFPQRIHALH